ncbi:MAG: hypothetical protein ACI8XB_001219, partial [Patiriisocius sp.]
MLNQRKILNNNFNMKKLISCLGIVAICAAFNLQAQTFSNMTSILNSVPGSSNQPCVVDMDGDGLDDVVRLSSSAVYIDYQQADGTFNLSTFATSIQNEASWSIAAGDVDNNGFCDIAIGGGSRASFLMANDNGTGFEEVYIDDYIFCQRSNFADIDNDGNLDAFICHDVDQSHPFRNDGNGNLSEDQTLIETVPLAGNYASLWVDFDHDNDLDLHIAKCRQGSAPGDPERMNGLYRNNGDGTFTECAADHGLNDGDQSWVTVFEDFDNDGDFDAYTVNHYIANILYENDGAGNFSQVTAGSGINENDLGSWACIAADFDNDGYIDILSESGSNDEYYHNDGDFTFTVSSMNFDDGALCDLNDDGFIDVFTGNTVWMNDANDNNWIKFNLQGLLSNASAIGAKVMIYGDFGVQIREVRSGQSFNPMSSLNQFFGLGSYDSVDYVEVIWPSGTVTTVDDPQINSTVTLIEADCLFEADDITASGPVTICPGESIELSAPGGYEYNWNQELGSGQTVTVSEPGNYYVIMSEIGEDCISISNTIAVAFENQDPPTINYEGDLLSCASDPVTLESSEGLSYLWNTDEDTQSITINETGAYSVSVENACGVVTSENINFEFLTVESPVLTSTPEIIIGDDVTLEATGDNISWYGDSDLTDLLGTGNSLDVTLTGDQTLYMQSFAESVGAMQEGGKPDFAGGGGLPSSGGGSTFNVWETFTLVSVRIDAPSSGSRTIRLVNSNGAILEAYTANMSGVMVLELNWDIPVGEDYQILCVQNNLFRNNGGVNYPYAIGDVGELYTSTFGGQYYYYFYDWQIQKQSFNCFSDIVAVELSIVGLEELANISGLAIYPNPASDFLNVSLDLKE